MKDLLPREKMRQSGVSSLTNEELLAVILGSGCKDCDVFDLSKRISNYLSAEIQIPTYESLMKIRGLGNVKAAQVLACLELSSRFFLSSRVISVKTPEDLVARLSFLKYEPQEHFILVSLNASNNVIRVHEITTGLVNQAPVHPRESFIRAIEDKAVSVIFAHNHPSGNLMPSPEDFEITKLLCAAGKIIQIPVYDHIIITKRGFRSFRRESPELFECSA